MIVQVGLFITVSIVWNNDMEDGRRWLCLTVLHSILT